MAALLGNEGMWNIRPSRKKSTLPTGEILNNNYQGMPESLKVSPWRISPLVNPFLNQYMRCSLVP